MPDPGRKRISRRLRSGIITASLVLVSAPLITAWLLGYYDKVVIADQQALLRSVQQTIDDDPRVSTATTSRALTKWLTPLATTRDVHIRVLDPDGSVRFATSPEFKHGLRPPASSSMVFYGPEGPPNISDFEAELVPPATRREVKAAMRNQAFELWRRDDSRTLLVFYRATPLPGGRVLYLTRGALRTARVVHDVRYQLLKVTIPLVMVALLVGFWISWRVVAPIERMQKAIRAYVETGRAGPIALERNDEIGALSRDFQELTNRLQLQLTRTAQVTADFTHDLKNPVAAVAASAEMLSNTERLDLERVQRIAQVMQGAAEHLQRSVDAMLDLARLEERLPSARIHYVVLADLVERVLESYRTDERYSGVSFDLDRGSAAKVAVIGDTIDTLVRNLLDNAASFAKSRVLVAVTEEGGRVQLSVSDDGAGVATGNHEKIFRRFFTDRPEGQKSGTGLGLAIVHAVAEAHRGTVWLADASALDGATFCVSLPRTGP